jgi:hypothetical protein
VQFARSIRGDGDYAIKFFILKESFDVEKVMYAEKTLKEFLPQPAAICDNESGEAVDARGTPLPPFIVMEKGESLDEWSQRRKPSVFAATPVSSLSLSLTEGLQRL